MRTIKIRDKQHLREVIEEEMKKNGNNCDLNHLDVSSVKDFKCLLQNSDFNGNVSDWDVAYDAIIEGLFAGSKFEGDLSKWNCPHVTDVFWTSAIVPLR